MGPPDSKRPRSSGAETERLKLDCSKHTARVAQENRQRAQVANLSPKASPCRGLLKQNPPIASNWNSSSGDEHWDGLDGEQGASGATKQQLTCAGAAVSTEYKKIGPSLSNLTGNDVGNGGTI